MRHLVHKCRASIRGGIRSINSPSLDDIEYFNESWPEARRTELPGGEEYDYVLDTDGSLTCTTSDGFEVPQDEWHR